MGSMAGTGGNRGTATRLKANAIRMRTCSGRIRAPKIGAATIMALIRMNGQKKPPTQSPICSVLMTSMASRAAWVYWCTTAG